MKKLKFIFIYIILSISLFQSVKIQTSVLACEIPYGLTPRIIMLSPNDNKVYGNQSTIKWTYYEDGTAVPSSACVINFTMYDVNNGEYIYIKNTVGGVPIASLPTTYILDIPEDAVIGDTYTFDFTIYFNMTIEGQLYRDNAYHISYIFEYNGEDIPDDNTSFGEKLSNWWHTYQWWILGLFIFLLIYMIYIIQLRNTRKFLLQKEQYKLLQYNPNLLVGGGGGIGVNIGAGIDNINYGIDGISNINSIGISPVGFPKECENINILMDKNSPQGKFCRKTYKNIFGKYPDEDIGVKKSLNKIGQLFKLKDNDLKDNDLKDNDLKDKDLKDKNKDLKDKNKDLKDKDIQFSKLETI